MKPDAMTVPVGHDLVDIAIAPLGDGQGWVIFTRLMGEHDWRVTCHCEGCRARTPAVARPHDHFARCASIEAQQALPMTLRPRLR